MKSEYRDYEIEDLSPIPFAHKKIIYDENHDIVDFAFIHINPALEKILGKTDGEVNGISEFEVLGFSKRQYEMRLESLNEKKKKIGLGSIEQYSKLYKKWFRSKYAFRQDDSVFVWLVDIDDKVYYENELIQSEELYKSVFDNIVDAIYIQKVEDDAISSTFIKVNKAACDMLEYSENELLKLSPKDISSAGVLPKFQRIIGNLFGNGYVRFESENISKSGKVIPVEVVSHIFPHRNEKMIATVVTNLNDRINAEKKEKENRKLLQSVLDTLPGLLIVIDTDYKVLACNKNLVMQHAGGQKHFRDYVGKPCYQVLSNNADICRNCNLKKILENPESFSEITEYEEQGSYKSLKRYFAPIINTEGKVAGIIEYVADITELKLMQRKAEAANRAKTNFMMNMSHELRTPLNGIMGFSGILEDMIGDEEQSEYIRNIKASGYHLLSLINDILDFSKTESQSLALKNEETNLRHLLDLSLVLTRIEAYKKGLETEFEYDERLPETVFTDRLRLSQIINNLLTNAVKFTEEGQITLKAELIDKIDRAVKIRFSVIDTGIGIKESVKERIFDSFTQGDSSTTRKYGGAGLGLALSKQLLGFFGSEMKVVSRENVGSSFSFELEMECVEKNKTPNLAFINAFRERDEKFKVLIVEDNLINMKLLRVILEKHFNDVEIFMAENGQDAIKLYLLNKPDIIFMDIRMPVMNGLEATKHIRKYDSGLTKIIGLSAEVRQDEIKLGIEGGMDGYLAKPVKENEIIDEISRVLEK